MSFFYMAGLNRSDWSGKMWRTKEFRGRRVARRGVTYKKGPLIPPSDASCIIPFSWTREAAVPWQKTTVAHATQMCQHVLLTLTTLSAHSALVDSLNFYSDWNQKNWKKMVLPILLYGAVPLVNSPQDQEINHRIITCCHCHVMEFLDLIQTDPVDNLPDVVPRDKVPNPPCEEPDSPVKDVQEPIQSPTDDKSAANWRQVGQDLRRIAEQFESSRRSSDQPSSSQHSWIQSLILHGLAAYVGWRIQRWVSG